MPRMFSFRSMLSMSGSDALACVNPLWPNLILAVAQFGSQLALKLPKAVHISSCVLRERIKAASSPKTTPVHELERYMRCKDCSQVRGYPYKRSHLVALRPTKISASDPPLTWWPGER